MKTLYALPITAFFFSGLVEAAPAPAAPAAAPPPAAPAAAKAPAAPAAAPAPAAPAAAKAPAATAPAAAVSVPPISVMVTNPLAMARPRETVALAIADLVKLVPDFDGRKSVVTDQSGLVILSQLVDADGDLKHDEIVFQADLGAKETKTFWVMTGERRPVTLDQYQAYGRFVRERYDDFAWENDLVAHRMYGAALETHPKEPLTSSGVDTWVKRVAKLVVNDWYVTGNYHKDTGEGADLYSVGKSRGLGGLGVWAGGKLHVSKNFVNSRVLANGPIRLVFELTYAPWKAGGPRVSEVKRVTLDAGSYFNRVESTFTARKKSLSIGIGIAKHAGSAVTVDAAAGTMQVWEPLDGGKAGNLGTAIVLPAGAKLEEQHGDLDYLVVTPVPADNRLVFYAGSAWDQAGNIRDAATWTAEVQSLAARLAAPVQVKIDVRK